MKSFFIGLLALPLITIAQQAPPAPVPQTATSGSNPLTSGYAENTQAASAKLGYSSVHVDGPFVAITFDDGPHATNTPHLLDILAKRNIKATFFVLGECAAEHPQILKRIAEEGHEIGNHSWSHPSFAKMSNEGVRGQIERTQSLIQSTTGKRPSILRPPYGAITPAERQWITKDLGLKIIMWSVDPLDWKFRDAGRVQKSILSQTKFGDIILAHDIHPSTIDAMPATLDGLLARGFKFVTVSELIAMEKPLPQQSAQEPQQSTTKRVPKKR